MSTTQVKRFKTEKEFIDQFGPNWRYNFPPYTWDATMDILFGCPRDVWEARSFGINDSKMTTENSLSPEEQEKIDDLIKERVKKRTTTVIKAVDGSDIELRAVNYEDNTSVGNSNQFLQIVIKTNSSTTHFYISKSPTGNCQLCAITYLNEILCCLKKDADVLNVIKTIKLKWFNKPLWQFDVSQKYRNRIENLPKLFVQNYISSNKSEMMMGIFDTTKF